VLAAGWRATDGWADAALGRFADPSVAAVVPLGVHAHDRGSVVTAGIRRTAGGRSVLNQPSKPVARIDSFRADQVTAPSAPALEAGFWRADVLSHGGFTSACGDDLAAADMSAALACAGAKVVVEPRCHVVWGQATKRGSSFLSGMHAELLFWRSLPAHSTLSALAAHAAEVVRHAATTAPLGTLPMLLGRLMALVQFGRCVPRAKELRAIRARRSHSPQEPRTLRIDSGHAVPSRPRRVGDTVPPVAKHPAVGESPLRRSA
jgi:hypothetical protein